MSQRRKQPEVTRQAILQAAGEGFALEGYAATGIGGIAERAGVTRGALFHHFEDKRGMAVAWVREMLATELEGDCVSMMAVAETFESWKQVCLKIARVVDAQHPIAQITLLGSEWSADEVLREEVALVLQNWTDGIARVLEHGQSQGWIHRSIHPADEAVLLASLYCGMSVLLRVGDSTSVVRNAERALGSYLETLKGG